MTTINPTIENLAIRLYAEACRAGEREMRGWPVDFEFWYEKAKRNLLSKG